MPKDRNEEFESKGLKKKNQNSISQDIGEKILSMYAKGMTTEGAPPDLYDQRNRGLQPTAAESDPSKVEISYR